MKIAICDDNIQDLDNLTRLLEGYCRNQQIPIELSAYTCSRELLADFDKIRFPLIFLDIYMKSPDGMQTAKLLRKKDTGFHLIFTTTSLEHPLQAFSVSATDYLIKPITYESLDVSMKKCQNLLNQTAHYLVVKDKKLVRNILIHDIFWTESRGRLTLLHLEDEIIETYLSYRELKKQAAGLPFLECIRGCLVNMNDIDAVLEHDFLLKNKDKVPIRLRGTLAVKQSYYDYLWSRTRKESI